MAKKTIYGAEPFQIEGTRFAVVSPDAFTLKFSADGENFTPWGEETPALENLQVINFTPGTWFMLYGNTETVEVIY